MIPDILNVVIPLFKLKKQKLSIKTHYADDDPSSFREILLLVIIVVSGLIIVSLL